MIEITGGDLIGFRGSSWQVRGYDGCLLTLVCLDDGNELTLPVGVVLSDETFVEPDSAAPSVADQRLLDLLTPQRRREAEFWYDHMYEVKHGIPLRHVGIIAATPPATTIESRLAAKRAELSDIGVRVSMTTMWRKWRGFTKRGVIGCADQRGMPGHVRLPAIGEVVSQTLRTVKAEFVDKSTPTKKQIIQIVERRLSAEEVAVPCRSSMYDLLDRLDRGEHLTGDATSRRSHATSPDRAFGTIVALFPGEEVQLDSTPLDAMVFMADGQISRVDLAAGIDVATRSITAAVLRPNACKTVDALELLSKSMIPQQMLPGWQENLAMARSNLPEVMVSDDDINAELANKPVIDVRGVVVDRGRIFVSDTFVRALETRGIHHRHAPPYTPTAKPHVERLIKTIGDDFVKWIPGYKGRSVAHRGRHPERDAVWPLPILQALLDEWIITVYQNRPHSGVTLAAAPRMKLSPNAIYRALTESCPTAIRTLTRNEWIGLQPCRWRVINRYGINLFRLVYDDDSARFHDLRRSKSPNRTNNGKWEIRFDPNNLLQIWVRDVSVTDNGTGQQIYRDNGWIECTWKLAKFTTIPFGVDVLRAIRRELGTHMTGKQVLDRAEAIHRQLLGGPGSTTRHQFSRAETTAGRSNLTRRELCSPPTDAAEPDAPNTAPQTPSTAAPAHTGAEPLRALRLSESW